MALKIEKFKTVDTRSMTFKDIFELYDAHFDTVYKFLSKLGDKYIVETFTGSKARRVELEHEYSCGDGQLIVYLNGSIQWLGEDYREISNKVIELQFDREIEDELKVVICQSLLLNGNIGTYIERLETMVENASYDISEASSLLNQLKLLDKSVSSKSEEFLENRFTVEEWLAEMGNTYRSFSEMYGNTILLGNTIQSNATKVEKNAKRVEALVTHAEEIKNSVERLANLTPEELADLEVIEARGGFPVLKDRLDKYSYTFDVRNDMQSCLNLKNGDICFVMGGEEFNDGNQGVYRVIELSSPESIMAEDYCVLGATPATEGNTVYAYKIGGFGYGSGGGTGTGTTGITFEVQNLEPTVYLELGETLSINYLFKSGILGGTLYYSTDGYTYTQERVSGSGYHTLNIGPFKTQASLNLRLYVIDDDGAMSDTLTYVLKVGDLSATVLTTISSYTDEDEVSVRWRVNDIYGEDITNHIQLKKNGVIERTYDEAGDAGNNHKNFGRLGAGHYEMILWLTNTSGVTSKRVSLVFNVSSATEISTYFLSENMRFLDTDSIIINYGLLYNGTSRFTTICSIDDEEYATLASIIGDTNSVSLQNISSGSHAIKLVTTSDNGLSHTLTGSFTIIETIKSDIEKVETNLVIDLDSRFKNNTDLSSRDRWDSNGKCQLKNFDFNNNGWIQSHVDSDTAKAVVLKMNGYDNYAQLDLCPFYNVDLEMTTGSTIEIKYKGYDLGDNEATVAECLDSSNKGFRITNNKIYFNPFGSIYDTKGLKVNVHSDEWIKVTLITIKGLASTNKDEYGFYTTEDLAVVGVNGTIMGVITGDVDVDYPMGRRYPVYFGAHYDKDLNYMTNYNKCEIQHFRVYNQSLNHVELLNNFIADIHDTALKQYHQILNDYNAGEPGTASQLSLPTLYIKGGDLRELDKIIGPVAKNYIFPNVEFTLTDPTGELGLENNRLVAYGSTLKVQGTSSCNYSIKNYKITFYKFDSPQNTLDIVQDKTTKKPLQENALSASGMYLNSAVKNTGKKKRVLPNKKWIPEHTYTLKADYMESSHARNVGIAKLTHTFFSDAQPPQRAEVSNPYYASGEYTRIRPAIDGFPMILINEDLQGEVRYKGIYNFNIDKGNEDYFGFAKYNENPDNEDFPLMKCLSYEMANNEEGGAGAFNMNSSTEAGRQSIATSFEIRYHPYEEDPLEGRDDCGLMDDENTLNLVGIEDASNHNESYYHSALVHLIDWVYSTRGDSARFKREVEKHFNLSTTLEYYLLTQTLCLADNLGKNCMLTTWDADEEEIIYKEDGSIDWENSTFAHWYPQFYDMDTCIGLDNVGSNVYDIYHDIRGNALDPIPFNTSSSVLWVNVAEAFSSELKARYAQLRLTNRISMETFESIFFDTMIDRIGQYYYNRDALAKYFGYNEFMYMCQGNAKPHFKMWLSKRLMYMDSLYGYGAENIIFRNRKRMDQTTANINFGIKVDVPQYITVQYGDNLTETKLCNSDSYTFFNQQISGSDSNIVITGKKHVTELTGLAYCNIELIDLSNAVRLRKLDLADCNYLSNLTIGNNPWLQVADISNTNSLSTNFDVSSMSELVELNARDSGITGVILYGSNNQKASNLKRMNLTGSKIQNLDCNTVTNIQSIGTLDFSGYSYSSFINKLNEWGISEEHRKVLLNELKDTLINNGVVSATTVQDMNLQQVFESFKANFTEVYVPGLIYLEPTTSINVVDFNSNNLIEAIYVKPTETNYFFGIEKVNLSYMGSLNYLYIYYSKAEDFNISHDDELTDVYLSTCTGIYELDLSTAYRLKKLQLPSCSGIRNVYLMPSMNTLKTLNLSYCTALEAFRYSLEDKTTKGLNLENFELTYVNFNTAISIPSITNIHATLGSLASVFYIDWRYNSTTLKTLTGEITITGGSMSQAFEYQHGLVFNLGKKGGLELNVEPNTSLYRCFNGCYKLTYDDMIYIMKKSSKVTSFNMAFSSCTGIVVPTVSGKNILPADLFQCGQSEDFVSPATTLENMFSNCTGMNNIVLPSGIFKPLTKVTTLTNFLYGGSVSTTNYSLSTSGTISSGTTNFNKSRIAGTVPNDLFNTMVSLQQLDNFFAGATITVNNINLLFNKCTKLQRLQNVFAKATLTLTTPISKEFFKNLTNVTNITSLFRGSNLSGNIPDNFFEYLTNLSTASFVFTSCKNLTGFGSGNFMRNCKKLSAMQFMFADSGLRGRLPENLLPLEVDSLLTRDMGGLFYNCTLLGNLSTDPSEGDIPRNFFAGQTKCTSIAYMFGNCTNLYFKPDEEDALGEQNYWFRDLLSLLNISGLFYGCVGVEGEIPAYGYEDLVELGTFYNRVNGEYVYAPLANKIGGFFACFRNGVQVDSPIQYARAVFYGCIKITGLVKGNMFTKMPKLKSTAYMFYRCKGIGTDRGMPIPTRRLPLGLFDDCTSLESTSYMFAQVRYIGKSEEVIDRPTVFEELFDEIYALPKYIFRYNPELSDTSGMFQTAWTDQSVTDENRDYYNSDFYGTLYPHMFANNPKLTNVENMFSYAYKIKGYETANYANGIDYNLFQDNPLIARMSGFLYATAIGYVERGFILKANQLAKIATVSNFVSPSLLTRMINGKYVGSQLVFDLETNSYLSFYDVYGIYVDSSHGF